ncbi:MAG TPA: GNAT family N-acetyltransferase [Ardenticatenaceae bacterium]|nr:GNAT family N-acetyltransferase [Ardenticatenaceae bacterium]
MTSTAFEVRLLTRSDEEAVLALARELAEWFRPMDQMALTIDLGTHEGFVAAQGGMIVGFLTFHLTGPAVAELSWLGVRPDVQRQGVGNVLVSALEAELRARGVRELEVSTIDASSGEPAFERARRFYQRHGFIPIRRDDNYFARGRHRLLLRKEIGE